MLDRRTLLKQAAGMGGALWAAQSMRAQPAAGKPSSWTLSDDERRTLAALQDRLLPSGPGSPGARDVNATAYLLAAAADTGVTASERADIQKGLKRLQAFAREQQKAAYAALTEEKQDAVLQAFQEGRGGQAFMMLVMVYTLEALLGDPVYGVNPNGVGWAWLKHDPGFPRPTAPWKGTP
jgi:gluconate 2-dehydrogenase gamma chain